MHDRVIVDNMSRIWTIPQAMKVPEAKAAVDKEWRKLEKIPAWQLTKVRNKKEVIAFAKNEGKTVFASLMDLCHHKNSELEPQFENYKGRDALRGDTGTSPELLIRIWMSSKRNASMIIGISMGQEICLIHGQVSLNFLYWKRNPQTDICGPG